MRTIQLAIVAASIGVVGVRGAVSQAPAAQSAGSHPLVTQAEYDRWQTELTNWGRWGKDDQMGALNLITPAKRKQAAALVKEGISVSLASNAATTKTLDVPVSGGVGDGHRVAGRRHRSNRISLYSRRGNDAHRLVRAHLLQRQDVERLSRGRQRLARCGERREIPCSNMKNGIVTRAVLYDIARLKGVPYLEPGTRIFPEDLEAWENTDWRSRRPRRCVAPPMGPLGARCETGAVEYRRGSRGPR